MTTAPAIAGQSDGKAWHGQSAEEVLAHLGSAANGLSARRPRAASPRTARTRCRTQSAARFPPSCCGSSRARSSTFFRRGGDRLHRGQDGRRSRHSRRRHSERADRRISGRAGGALDGSAAQTRQPARPRAARRRGAKHQARDSCLAMCCSSPPAMPWVRMPRLLEAAASMSPRPRSPANRCPSPNIPSRCRRTHRWRNAVNMIYSGTHIAAGRGRAVVVATALDTEVGKIATLTEGAKDPQTPLEAHRAIRRWLAAASSGSFSGFGEARDFSDLCVERGGDDDGATAHRRRCACRNRPCLLCSASGVSSG